MMKQFCVFILFSVITALILPLLVFEFADLYINKTKEETDIETDETISVYFHNENMVHELPLEEYIYSVVAAEMPATFETEALKAQAVAARSYALHRKENPSPDHPGACVCTDYTHCKAYKSKEELDSQWKENSSDYETKIKNAVYSTQGEIITYNGEVALAVFHSQAGSGRTESSKDVWGGDVPYLVSVESHGEQTAPNFYSTVTVPFDEFKKKITEFNPAVIIESYDQIGKIEKSDGGNVKTIQIGGEQISGKDMRQIFNLRSSCFTVNADDEKVTFQVTGYGHGVGMSQYGANTMAKEGFSYIDILTHYYSGTQIVSA